MSYSRHHLNYQHWTWQLGDGLTLDDEGFEMKPVQPLHSKTPYRSNANTFQDKISRPTLALSTSLTISTSHIVVQIPIKPEGRLEGRYGIDLRRPSDFCGFVLCVPTGDLRKDIEQCVFNHG